MSIKTTYTCDRCKTVQDTITQFWTIAVVVKEGTMSSWSEPDQKRKMDVCRSCLELLGFYRAPSCPAPPLPPPPTLEDLIREIASHVVTDMTGAT
jgi:hypothetical protein